MGIAPGTILGYIYYIKMSDLYIKYMKLEKENGLLKNEIRLMQESLQNAYIRIKELIEEKNDNSNS